MGGSAAVLPDLATPTGIPAVAGHEPLPTAASAIGDPYAEGHGKCAAGGPGCFLSPADRAIVANLYEGRVNRAAALFTTALTQVRFDELIKKEDDVPLWVGMLFDIIGALAVGAVGSGIKLAQQGTGADLGSLQSIIALQETPHDPGKPSFSTLMHSVNPGAVTSIAKTGVDLAKPATKAKPPDHEKEQKLSYIEELEVSSALAWQAQAEGPPSYASDAELIVLYHAFDARNGHNVVAYKAALEDKVKRFIASPVSRIGRVHTNSEKDTDVSDRGTAGFVMRDTKVVWVQHHDHLPPTLYYEKRDASDNNNDYTREQLELTPLVSEASFHLTTPVEPEFIEAAIARHAATWGGDPEVYDIDGVPAPWAGAKPAPAPLPANNKVAPTGLGLPALPGRPV